MFVNKSKIVIFFFCLLLISVCLIYILSNNNSTSHPYYDFPSENNGWTKYGCEPVLGDSLTGTLFDPYVYLDGDSLIMLVSGRSAGTIIRYSSTDGIHWSNPITALEGIQGTWQNIVNRACVLKKDSVWHMYYTGQFLDTSKIGHAISLDGYKFIADSLPVISATTKLEGVSCMNPCVIYDNGGKYMMWYAAGENYEPDALFYAESLDGLEWNKSESPVLKKYRRHKWECCKVGGCYVVNDTTDQHPFTMYYIGYQTVHTARICFATSEYGIGTLTIWSLLPQ